MQYTLDAFSHAAASVRDQRLDVLADNELWRALYPDMYAEPTRPPNMARFVFLNPAARDFYPDWDRTADEAVAVLHAAAGRDPSDRRLSDLIGELSTKSDEFRVRWATHNVRIHGTGTKRFNHPVVGELTLAYETMQLVADSDLTLLAYTAEPRSKSAEALDLLASWAATPEEPSATRTPGAP